jgi:asparagine synthase (glutamine-hydrolysing)
MCGIAGIVAQTAVNPRAVKEMTDRLAHRGPDDSGLWSTPDTRVSFGHRRLSILDPSPRGHQPMVDATGTIVITFNGEIYNYREIAACLREEGVVFQTETDTEVLIEAYRRWGEDFLHRLNGMFAFCLYDAHRELILCARDRFGEKPFLFTFGAGFFAFASEYKALLALAEVSHSIDETRVLRFLQSGRMGLDESPATVFPSIRQLDGGEKLVLDIRSLDFRIESYWTLTRDPALRQIGETEAVDRFRDVLVDSVKLRMRSDVELGSCLSGGLDSSAIVCIARRLIGEDKPYHVFSGRFPGTAADEGRFADAVVAATHATLHIAEPKPGGLLDRLDRFVWFNELPVASTSQYAQWCVFAKAREMGVTVLLDGQGADELLGGYEQYFEAYLAALCQSGHAGQAAEEGQAIALRYPLALAGPGQRFKRSLPDRLRKALARLSGRGSDFAFGVARDLGATVPYPATTAGSGVDALSAALEEDAFHAHLPALLRYGDRNSMAHSREVRLPFCDHRLAELVLSLPPGLLMGGIQTKRLLRRSMQGIVPDVILDRWNKQGFLPPQELWFAGDLGKAAATLIHDPAFAARGWWNVGWWKAVLRRFERGETHLAWVLWKPLIAEAWLRHFVQPLAQFPRESVFAGPAPAQPASGRNPP